MSGPLEKYKHWGGTKKQNTDGDDGKGLQTKAIPSKEPGEQTKTEDQLFFVAVFFCV